MTDLQRTDVVPEPTTESTAVARPTRVLVIPVIGAVVIAIVAALVFWRHHGQEAAIAVPYDDPQAAGLITLCSADGDAVTGGSVDDRPFAAYALGETGLPAGTDPAGAVATLYAYQPRAGIEPDEFSGNAISAAATLADPTHPATVVDEGAWSIGDFVTAFPATEDGFVQLRLYLGTPAAGTLSDQPYDTADLRVDGDRWELVRGGSQDGGASCADAGASCADAGALVR